MFPKKNMELNNKKKTTEIAAKSTVYVVLRTVHQIVTQGRYYSSTYSNSFYFMDKQQIKEAEL